MNAVHNLSQQEKVYQACKKHCHKTKNFKN